MISAAEIGTDAAPHLSREYVDLAGNPPFSNKYRDFDLHDDLEQNLGWVLRGAAITHLGSSISLGQDAIKGRLLRLVLRP
ncbi:MULTISPECIES: hypothetical protein [Chelativorans]|jgi:hypothetical protein|uniref:Uncharacterized protein n=1 Tax=Chelativorans sp. (strain BNC1) TaxID=266779 RepID=Q11ML1_CHESB|nr:MULTISPECIES: hypothetical protein [Chelativorans]